MSRISRPCYDKYHRCPGWNGGGNKYPKVDLCDSGYIQANGDSRWWKWQTHRCNRCDVIVLPYMIRYFDPTNWLSEIRFWWRCR